MEMKMDVNLECSCCVADVYRLVGLFLQEDEGGSCLMSVNVDHADRDDGKQSVYVVFGWDIPPKKHQVRLLRQLWDRETNMGGIVIGHDAPNMDFDFPVASEGALV